MSKSRKRLITSKNSERGPWDTREFSTQAIMTTRPFEIAGMYWPRTWGSWMGMVFAYVWALLVASQYAVVNTIPLPVRAAVFVPLVIVFVAIVKLMMDRKFHVCVYPDGFAEYEREAVVRALRWGDIYVDLSAEECDVFPTSLRASRNSHRRAFGVITSPRDGNADAIREFPIPLTFRSINAGYDLKDMQSLRKCFFDAMLAARPDLRVHPDVWTLLCLDPVTHAYSPWPKRILITKVTTAVAAFAAACVGGFFWYIEKVEQIMPPYHLFDGFPPWYIVAPACYCFIFLCVASSYD